MASILIIDDEPSITSAFAMFFRQNGGHTVAEAHGYEEGVAAWRRLRPDLTLLDVLLPDGTGFDVLEALRAENPVVIMITAHGDVPMAVRALQSGAENFLTKPIDLPLLQAAAQRGLEKAALRRLDRLVMRRRGDAPSLRLGPSPLMRDVAMQLELLAQSDRTVGLLLGESGTGKGRIAEQLHALSPRAHQPFVDVNCGAFFAESLDVELFGEERGGAARAGIVESAAGGTLFLDEIGDLDAHLQPKISRVLEGRGLRRVGGSVEFPADVRIIAATSKDLAAAVSAGRFREDLYYRLNVMPVTLPPLRARTHEDLVELVGQLVHELARELPDAPTVVGTAALDLLLRYAWPGNIRELRNVLERALLLARNSAAIAPEHLPAEVRGATGVEVDHHTPRSLEDVERVHIDRTLRAHHFNRTHTAKELGISRATLIKKIQQYGLGSPQR
jgi:two-component system, NtrC family, response regulator AtoC